MRVLVCGGRDYDNYQRVFQTLTDLAVKTTPMSSFEIIQGGAKGADFLARCWAATNGFNWYEYPADWKTHGPAAGPMRNKQMLEEGKPDLVIAFPGGKGTAHMVKIAQEAGIPVKEII